MNKNLTLFLSLILLVMFSNKLLSQIIDNQECNAFSDEPFFNEYFIKINNIKKLTANISTKKELSVIKETNLVMCYEFNTNGELEGYYHSLNKVNKIDTSFIDYKYSESGILTAKRSNDSYGFYSYNYDIDSLNRVIKKTYCREKNIGKNRNNFILGTRYVIFSEAYSYRKTKNGYIRSVLNNNGRPYQRYEFVYDSLSYLKTEIKQLLINNKKAITHYEYNEKGLVSSKAFYSNEKTDEPSEEITYKYDQFGNITYIDEYKNNKHITHKEMLYDKSSFILKTLIEQNVETNFIKIIKFKVEFYGDSTFN